MKDLAAKQNDQEIHLEPSDIFYSRTDERGVIHSGNSTFYRISGYAPEELIGAPHKIMRHPDMPKAVFWLMWDMIKRGEPAVAYVKNRAKCGRHYWVLALVRPIRGGYLSVRLRPQSGLFGTAKALYAELRAMETQKKIAPEKSAGILLERLKAAGFESYSAFMTEALRSELIARLEGGEGEEHDFLTAQEEIRSGLENLAHEQAQLTKVFQTLYLLPMNLRIMASRQAEAGGPISAVSEAYRVIVSEVSEMLLKLQADEQEGLEMSAHLEQAMLDVCSLLVQSECASVFEDEDEIPGQDRRAERKALNKLTKTCERHARHQLADVMDGVQRLTQNCYNLRAEIARLDQIRVMGGVESRRLGGDPELVSLMEQLRSFHADIGQRLSAMIDVADCLQSKTRRSAG